MSVCELATLLRQFEQAMPNRDVEVWVEYEEWDSVEKCFHTVSAMVPVEEFRWGTRGAVVVAGRVP